MKVRRGMAFADIARYWVLVRCFAGDAVIS